MKASLASGFTRAELLFSLTLIATLGILLFGASAQEKKTAFGHFMDKSRMTNQLSNGLNIYKAMVNYATNPDDDGYPAYTDREDPATEVKDSNAAFEILLAKGVLDDKKVFFNAKSAWCTKLNPETPKKLEKGENDWCYVRGLRRTSRANYPLLANAFTPDTKTYVSDPAKKGGVWGGIRAIVIYAGGNGEVAGTGEKDKQYFIRRVDKPLANAFEVDGDWLAGDSVKVLHPKAQ
jgi:hypothetical protein